MHKSIRKKQSEYEQKRDFSTTPEPQGKRHPSKKLRRWPIFVIQKHDARALHYDFRLEIDGVLKSWAVPKGPSLNPRERRLAILTEDHPLEYASFEGIIPKGQYGGGTVLVWDTGIYANLREQESDTSMEQSFQEGKIEIVLSGQKIAGGYVLVRRGRGDNHQWFLIKMKDEQADLRRDPVSTAPVSVISGRTLKQIEDSRSS